MKNKMRRLFIGLILPIIAAILICGVFYYKNAHVSFMKEYQNYEGDTSEQVKGIIIRKDNWQDYFILEAKQNSICLSLKEEYRTELTTERDSFVNITGRLNSNKTKNESKIKQFVWNSALGTVYETEVELDNDEYLEEKNLQIPEEFEIEEVSGQLYLLK